MVILSYLDGRGREAFKVLQRPMAIKVVDANALQKERKASMQQRRRNEEKKKEAEQREQRNPKRSESIIFILLWKVQQKHRFVSIPFRRRAKNIRETH